MTGTLARLTLCLTLVGAVAGCGVGTLKVTNIQTGRTLNSDNSVGTQATTFKPTDTIYVAVLTALVLGFLAGGLVAWGADRRYRVAARVRGRKAAQLERELAREREQRTAAEKRVAEAAQTLANANSMPALTSDAAARRSSNLPRIEAVKAY